MSETSTTPEPRLITNTSEPTRHPWPENCFVQGGTAGVVFHGDQAYRTAFVEAFPRNPDTFLRGEGSTITDAEDACWAQYERYAACEHGPYERRGYRNGAGFCVQCNTFFSGLFVPLPADPQAPVRKSLMERVLVDQDPTAVAEVLTTMTRIGELPEAPPAPACSAEVSDHTCTCLTDAPGGM